MQGISIKIMDASKSFISFRYMNSNARSRVRRAKFMEDYKKGIFNIENPQLLGEEAEQQEA